MLETIARAEGYPLGARRCGSRSASVTQTKTANTASSAITIADCVRSTKRGPATTSHAEATRISEAKSFVHALDAP